MKGYFQIGSMVCEGHLRDKYIDKKEVLDDELKRNITEDNDRIKRLNTPFYKALSNKDFLLRSSTTTLLDDTGLLYSTGWCKMMIMMMTMMIMKLILLVMMMIINCCCW